MTTSTNTKLGTAGRCLAHEVQVGDRVLWGGRQVTITGKTAHAAGAVIELWNDRGENATFGRGQRFTRLPAGANVRAMHRTRAA